MTFGIRVLHGNRLMRWSGTDVTLNFNLEDSTRHCERIAHFASPEEQAAYVRAESRACQEKYFALAQAQSKRARKVAKRELDEARWAFFQQWRADGVIAAATGRKK